MFSGPAAPEAGMAAANSLRFNVSLAVPILEAKDRRAAAMGLQLFLKRNHNMIALPDVCAFDAARR